MTNRGEQTRNTIIEFIKSFQASNGYWPKMQDIVNGINRAKTTVHFHVQKLIETGQIENPARSVYRLPDGHDD